VLLPSVNLPFILYVALRSFFAVDGAVDSSKKPIDSIFVVIGGILVVVAREEKVVGLSAFNTTAWWETRRACRRHSALRAS